MSELLRKACAEAKEGNSNTKQQVRDIGNKYLNSVHVSAQEAVYIILQLSIHKSSREVIFNTSPLAERVELLKSMSEIEEMEDECEEIHLGGILKRYTECPASLKSATLADWAAWYDSSSKHYNKKTNTIQIDLDNLPTESLVDDETNDDDLSDNNMTDKLKTKNGIKKQSNSRVIRSVWFNREAQPEKHYRELLMLFTAWRNEETDLISQCSSFQFS